MIDDIRVLTDRRETARWGIEGLYAHVLARLEDPNVLFVNPYSPVWRENEPLERLLVGVEHEEFHLLIAKDLGSAVSHGLDRLWLDIEMGWF